MTDDALAAAQPADERFTPEELADLTADGIDLTNAIKIGGRVFTWHEGTATEVHFAGDDSKPEQTVVVPTDWMPGATEDDVKLAAEQHLHDVRALETRFLPEHVEGTIADLEAADIFRTVVDMAAALIREGASVTIDTGTDDPDSPLPDDLTDDERRQIAERCTAALHDEMADVLADVALTGENAPAFKRDFALHLLAESWAWALQDAREIAAELEAMAGDGEEMPPEVFEELHQRTYHEGTYFTRALLDHPRRAAAELAEMVARGIEAIGPDLTREMARAAVQAIRGGGDGRRKPAKPKSAPPAMTPGFHEGWGTIPSDPLHRTAIEAIQAAADNRGWLTTPGGRPYYASATWPATVSVADEGAYATAEAALAVVRQLDDGTADVFDVVLAHWLANHRKDPEGLAYITAAEILAQRGRKPEKHRGYELADKQAVSQAMHALAALEVEGRNFERYEKAGKGRGRKVTIAPVGRLIEVPVREDLKHLDGTRGPAVGWYYRAGRWSASFLNDAGTPLLAQMMQTVVALDPYQNRHAKRLGRYLTWQYRVRAATRTYDQAWTLGRLLAGAGIALPDRNPGRFVERIEAALNVLQSPGVQGPPVIASWEYRDTDELPPRRLLQRWLERRVVILPPSDLVTMYEPIGRRRLAGKRAPKRAVDTAA